MVAKIVKVFPIVEREWTDRNRQSQIFKSKGIVFFDGQSFYGEAIQEKATEIEGMKIQAGEVVLIDFENRTRSYKDTKGIERITNEITIKNVCRLWEWNGNG